MAPQQDLLPPLIVLPVQQLNIVMLLDKCRLLIYVALDLSAFLVQTDLGHMLQYIRQQQALKIMVNVLLDTFAYKGILLQLSVQQLNTSQLHSL